MSDDLAERVAVIDGVTLLPLIERALGVAVRGVSNWHFTPIGGGYAARVWRFNGQADLQTGPAAWSMVLKVPSEEVGVGDPWGGVRESVVYQSDFRSPVPDTFTLPNCYGVVEQLVGRSWIWLEDVIHDSSPIWSAARYTDVARHLGQFNGAFLVGYPLPSWPWLGTKSHLHQLIQILLPTPDLIGEAIPFWRQQGEFANRVMDRFVDLYERHQSLLALVDRLPLTLCHGDAFQRNLLVRETPDTSSQVVAIDWSQAGLSVPGADAGHLISLGALFSHITPNQMSWLDHIIFPAYVQGLRDAGWQGDERLIRLGYAASTVLWDGLILIGTTLVLFPHEQERAWMPEVFGWPPPMGAQYLLTMLQYHLDLADEARHLNSEQNENYTF